MSPEQKEAIAARLEQIAKRNGGRLTPDAVVEDARAKDSPLHDQFTWDVKEAAAQYWLAQARTLIRTVQIEITTETKIVSTVRYVRDPSADKREQGYVDVLALRSEEDLAREALLEEFGRARAMMDRAIGLAEALGLTAEVSDIAERIEKLRGKLSLAA